MQKKESNWSVVADIFKAAGIVLLLGAIISAFIYFMTNDAEAAELKLIPDYPVAWIGAEYDFSNEAVTCTDDGLGWNGNVGVRQPLADYGPTRFNGILQHHSCAFSSDNTDYNALGVNIEFHFGRLFNK